MTLVRLSNWPDERWPHLFNTDSAEHDSVADKLTRRHQVHIVIVPENINKNLNWFWKEVTNNNNNMHTYILYNTSLKVIYTVYRVSLQQNKNKHKPTNKPQKVKLDIIYYHIHILLHFLSAHDFSNERNSFWEIVITISITVKTEKEKKTDIFLYNLHKLLYVNCFGRTTLYMCIEYGI